MLPPRLSMRPGTTAVKHALHIALIGVALTADASCHGGQYRGPASVSLPELKAPPYPGGRTIEEGPGALLPNPLGNPPPPRTGTQKSRPEWGEPTVVDDLTEWQFWWEFNKDAFFRPRSPADCSSGNLVFLRVPAHGEAMDIARPALNQKKDLLLALPRVLASSDHDREIASACMIAIAKIGMDHDSFQLLDEFKKRLSSKDQQIREVAVLSMGIAQRREAVDAYLVPIVEDNQRGRDLVALPEVDDHTRSFACYALGLVAGAVDDVGVKTQCLTALKKILEDERIASRGLKIAAIHGLRLVPGQP
jgi:hypothetical protein